MTNSTCPARSGTTTTPVGQPVTAATVVLVHGAFCGDWVFWKLAPCLEERVVEWVSADLPTCRATNGSIRRRCR
jgi:hypothetical protein